MRKIITICFFTLLFINSQGQTYTYKFKFGSNGTAAGQFKNPKGIAFDASGNVYVADYGNNRIQKFTSTGTYLQTISGNGLTSPNYIAIDKDGNIYVTDATSIKKYNSSGTYLTKWGTSWFGGICIDTAGVIYVADYTKSNIKKYSSTGILLGQFGSKGTSTGQLSKPLGVSIDDSLNVYVTDVDNGIQKFNSSGIFVKKFTGRYELAIKVKDAIYLGAYSGAKCAMDGTQLLTWDKNHEGKESINYTYDLDLHANKDLYVVDYYNHTVTAFFYCAKRPIRPDSIIGETSPCPKLSKQKYSIYNPNSSLKYYWKVPTDWQITKGQDSSSIEVTIGEYNKTNYITVLSYDSCSFSSVEDTLKVKLDPAPSIFISDKYICENDSAIFEGGPGNANYTWDGPKGFTSVNQKISVNDIGQYKLKVTNIYGCIDSAIANVSERTYNCEKNKNYPWLWKSHKNWLIANNGVTGQIVDTESGFVAVAGNGTQLVQQYEGSTCVSDDQGSLLFYSGGRQLITGIGSSTVLKYNGLLAGNEGGGMSYKTSAVQGIITVRHPLNPNNYFVLTTDDALTSTQGLNYFVFDKNGNNLTPLGANRLGNFRTTEAMAATRHANGLDIWITVIASGTGKFYSYLLKYDGMDTVPVISINAPLVTSDQERGGMSFSYDGKRLATGSGNIYDSTKKLCVYQFNNNTGEIFDQKGIAGTQDFPYDVIFSPDGSKVYYVPQGYSSAYLTYFDISNWGAAASISATKVITTIATNGFGALEYANDGHLYIGGGIGNPIKKILGNYNTGENLSSTNFTGTIGAIGLPTMYLPPAEKPKIVALAPVCNDSLIDINTTWKFVGTNAEDSTQNNQYSGAGIVDGTKGIFDPSTVGEGSWKITFERTIGNTTFKDSTTIVVEDCITAVKNIASQIITLYPNPAKDVVWLKTNAENFHVKLSNVHGQVIKEINSVKSEIEISLNGLSKGVYFVSVFNDDDIQVIKFIKE